MNIFLETERLFVKPPSFEDIEEIYLLQSDSEVMTYIGTGARTREKVIDAMESTIKHFKDHGFGMCSLFEKETGHFVGQAGIFYLEFNDQQPDIEVGYRLHKKYWGRGYATEITKALLAWGFKNLSVDYLMAVINPANEKSKAVLVRSGMHYEGKQTAYGIEVLRFSISKNRD